MRPWTDSPYSEDNVKINERGDVQFALAAGQDSPQAGVTFIAPALKASPVGDVSHTLTIPIQISGNPESVILQLVAIDNATGKPLENVPAFVLKITKDTFSLGQAEPSGDAPMTKPLRGNTVRVSFRIRANSTDLEANSGGNTIRVSGGSLPAIPPNTSWSVQGIGKPGVASSTITFLHPLLTTAITVSRAQSSGITPMALAV